MSDLKELLKANLEKLENSPMDSQALAKKFDELRADDILDAKNELEEKTDSVKEILKYFDKNETDYDDLYCALDDWNDANRALNEIKREKSRFLDLLTELTK